MKRNTWILMIALLAIFWGSISYFTNNESIQPKEIKEEIKPIKQPSNYEFFLNELDQIKTMDISTVDKNIEELDSAYGEVAPFDRDKIKTKLVHLKYRKAIIQLSEHNDDRDARSELYRLRNIDISIPLPEYKDEYNSPKDLYWGFFLSRNEVVVSQTPRQHYSNNGLLARDIATSGLALKVRAPDLYNKELTWNIEAKDNLKGTGKTLILTSEDKQYQVLVGHIHSWNGKTTAKTGEVIAIVGGDKGAVDEGVSTGRHIHVEYRFFDKYKEMYTPFIYSFNAMDWHPQVSKNKKQKIVKDKELSIKDNLDPDDDLYKQSIFFTSYNPKVAQNDSTPCIGASENVCDMAKKGIRTIALSRDLIYPRPSHKQADLNNGYCDGGKCKYSYGDTVILETKPGTPGHNDHRCNGEFILTDTMNKRFKNRGDIFFMDKKDNISCIAYIKGLS